MRRSAAALLARPPPLPAPPPPEGLEAVRAAAEEEMRAVDDKLAAVRAAVSGGRIAQLAGPGRVSAVQGGAGMRRSGSDSELRRLQSSSESSHDDSVSAIGTADDNLFSDGLWAQRERWLRTRRSSCPLLMPAFAGSSAAGPGSPADSSLADGWSWHGHGGGGGSSGGGGGVCGAPAAAAAPKQGTWRWRQLPPAPRALRPCQSMTLVRPGTPASQVASASRPLVASVSFPRLPYSSGGGGGGGGGGGNAVTAASATAAFTDDHGGGAALRVTQPCSRAPAGGGPSRLSPMRAGPILTGRAGL